MAQIPGAGLDRDFADLGPVPAVLPPWSFLAALALLATVSVIVPAALGRLRGRRASR